jgi:hypothetical protein
LAAAENLPRFFLIAFLNSPCYETPKKRDKKKIVQNNRGIKQTGEKKSHIFCDELRWIVFKTMLFFSCFLTPLVPLRNAQKREKQKPMIPFFNKVPNYLFFGAAANVRHFHRVIFYGPP